MPLTGPALGALRILLVEDSPEDAELMSEQMLDAGLEATFERVESADDLRHALARFQPDIVLSDLSMPGFSGDDALRIVREDDLPGAEAPAAWLEYLRGGSADKLRRVAAHNHQDVVSLSRLVSVLALTSCTSAD